MKWKRQIPDPVRGLTLQRLNRELEAFDNGYIAGFAATADAMERRDDILRNVILKRKKALSRYEWEILVSEETEEARAHQEALEFFYNNLRCTHALKEDARGGFNLLVHQMLDCLAKGWAVHEITWQPVLGHSVAARASSSAGSIARTAGPVSPPLFDGHSTEGTSYNGDASAALNGSGARRDAALTRSRDGRATRVDRSGGSAGASPYQLTAMLRFIPLWFFENTTARLRFISDPGKLTGEPLKPREWLITTAEPLMIPCARAFLFKHMPLQGWLDYCEKYGMPGIRGITSAPRDSAEWNTFASALDTFLRDLAVITNSSENIEVIDLKGHGEPPFAALVERMDRTMAAIWRGADLSTLSRDKGYGASLQEEEARLLENDDARLISENLNSTLDEWVIKYLFGEEATPKAYIQICIPARERSGDDLAVDEFFLRHGVALDRAKTLERYGRTPAEPGKPAIAPQILVGTGSTPSSLAAHASTLPSYANTTTPNRRQHFFNSTTTENSKTMNTILVSPLGDFPHQKGIQRIDNEALQSLTSDFNSLLSKLGRLFVGVPFYIGHPDVPGLENSFPDRKAYGWVTELSDSPDGLYARVKWSKAGQELVSEGHYRFLSPYWTAAQIGNTNGQPIYRPTSLISIGLTNHPNLPVLPFENSRELPAQLCCTGTSVALDLPNTTNPRPDLAPSPETAPPSPATVVARPSSAASSEASRFGPTASQQQPNPTSATPSPSPEALINSVVENGAPADLALLNQRLEKLEQRLITLALDNAILGGKLLPTERDQWAAELANNFDAACTRMVNTPKVLKTEPRLENFVQISQSYDNLQVRKKQLDGLLSAKMGQGLSYDQAWQLLKQENPALFASMQQPTQE